MNSSPARKRPAHDSYRRHRRQVRTQILMPVIIGAVALVAAPAAAWITALDDGGDVSRWADISTMWLLIPVMIGALFILVLVIALAYVTARISGLLPAYSYRVQRITNRVESGTRRVAEMVRKPILAVRAGADMLKDRVKRLRERV